MEAPIESRTDVLWARVMGLWAPPPRESVSDWAEHNIVLPDSAAEPGPFRHEKTPWLREIEDASGDPRVFKIVQMIAVQLAKTQGMLNIIGYRIDRDPCPMLFLEPGQEDAEDFSKERLQPMLEDSPALARRVTTQKSRTTSTTILRKDFAGGFIGLVGVNAPRGLRRRAVGVVFADEVDEYPPSSGNQGSPLWLAEKRLRTFKGRNPKFIISSTPTIKDESAIEREYASSTMEQWCVGCPSCGEVQPYEWKRLIFRKGKNGTDGTDGTNGTGKGKNGTQGTDGTDRTGTGKVTAGEREALAKLDPVARAAVMLREIQERAVAPEMCCRKCGALHGEYEWKAGEGSWVAQKPERLKGHNITRGFHMNSMASPWVSWDELVAKFLAAVDEGRDSLQTFINTELAELWEMAGEKVDEGLLKQRRHYYDCDVPVGVVWITAGVDVQKDRLELELVGWGIGEESWGLQYVVIPGDTQADATWEDLDEALGRTFLRADGVVMPISCTAIDSQYATSRVLSFCKPRNARHVWAIRGEGGPGRPVVGKPAKRGRGGEHFVFPVGTDASKDLFFSNLSLGMQGPGYCHYPVEAAFEDGSARGYDEAYFKGLLTERRVRKRSGGQVWHVWEKPKVSARNEPLDTRVYATAALRITNVDLRKMARIREKQRGREQGAESGDVTPKLPVVRKRTTKGRRVLSKGIE